MQGWVKFHRKISQWEWYTDPNTFRLFFHLVLNANHKNIKWQGIVIERGQLVTSSEHLAKELKLTRQQIRTSLNKLKSTNELTIKSTNKYTLITIEKYSDYQSEDEETTNKLTNKSTNEQPSNNHQITTNKNVKNIKNEKNNKKEDIAHSYEQNISDEKASLNNDLEKYFDEIWKSYPLKKGKGRISTTKKKELYKLGDEIKRCVSRYIAHVENERNKGFKELRYQDGSTFFNRGYIDFLDENFQELEVMGEEKKKKKKVVDFEC